MTIKRSDKTPLPTICLFAGEPSGDYYAAYLIDRLKKQGTGARVAGMGSTLAKQAGMTLWHDCQDLGIIGFSQVLANLLTFTRLYKLLTQQIVATRPSLIILIDYAGLNLKIARFAKQLGIPCLYFIPPKVWAWQEYRLKYLRAYCEELAVLYPFEADYFRQKSLPATLVHHPFLDTITPQQTRPPKPFRIAVLPGSRPKEVATHLPIQLAACAKLQKSIDSPIHVAVFVATPTQRDRIISLCDTWRHDLSIEFVMPEDKYDALRQCHSACCVSGTITVELALIGLPHIIIYKTSWLNYAIGKSLLRIRWIGLTNLIVQESIVPELIQTACNPDSIAHALAESLQETTLHRVRAGLQKVSDALSNPNKTVRIEILVQKLLVEQT